MYYVLILLRRLVEAMTKKCIFSLSCFMKSRYTTLMYLPQRVKTILNFLQNYCYCRTGIRVAPRKFGKKNNRRPWKNVQSGMYLRRSDAYDFFPIHTWKQKQILGFFSFFLIDHRNRFIIVIDMWLINYN